jgi:hypothetical protein
MATRSIRGLTGAEAVFTAARPRGVNRTNHDESRERRGPDLPEELQVFCPECNHNFATGEGAPWCGEPPSCRWAAEGYQHAENARRFQGAQR